MVACTPLGLPYQEGADAPCDMSEIWCQFTDVLEAHAIETQNIVNRTAVGVPMAKVAKSVPQTLTFNASLIPTGFAIDWDSVVVDNDQMVDLAASDSRVFVRRPGIWEIIAEIAFTPPVGAGSQMTMSLYYSVGAAVIDVPATVFIVPGPFDATAHIVARQEVTAADLAGTTEPSFILTADWTPTVAVPDVTVFSAQMHVLWTAEEVP